MRALSTLKTSFEVLKGDKVAVLLSLLPVGIGLTGLYFFSEWFFTGLPDQILEYFGYGEVSSRVLQGVVITLLAIGYYFMVNLLFILMVSVVASPFNDFLSTRVGKKLGEGESPPAVGNIFRRVWRIWFNELKKIACIGSLTTLSLLLGFFPPLIPLSIVLSSLLLSASFLDYNWSRRSLSLRGCLQDMRRHWWHYGLSGFLFLFAFTIPVLNVFMVPFAVVYYTVMYVQGNSLAKRGVEG